MSILAKLIILRGCNISGEEFYMGELGEGDGGGGGERGDKCPK